VRVGQKLRERERRVAGIDKNRNGKRRLNGANPENGGKNGAAHLFPYPSKY
jgi:hypothetical protein